MKDTDQQKERGSALQKALLVLDAIVEQNQPVGLPDISARVQLARQTVHRILTQLELLGLIIRDPSRDRFTVGPRLSHLSLNVLRSSNNRTPVRLILTDLVEQLQETCNVGILDGMEYVYIERIECDWPLRIHLQAGSRVPAHCTAGGKLMLAHLRYDTLMHCLQIAPLEKYTKNTLTDISKLQSQLDQIKEQGYSINNEEYTEGLMAIGVPIRDSKQVVLAALAVHAPVSRLSIEKGLQYMDQLQKAAERISEIWTNT